MTSPATSSLRRPSLPRDPPLSRVTRPSKVRRAKHAAVSLPWPTTFVRGAMLAVFALFFGIPLLWLVLAPTKSNNQLTDDHPLSFGSWSRLRESWDNLVGFQDGIVLDWMFRSITYGAGALVIGVTASLLAGYAMAMTEFPGKRLLVGLTLATMMLPVSASVLPIFLGVNRVGMLNTAWSVVLPMSFFPFGAYLAYIYYRRSLPPSLVEAAAIDGASPLATFLRVVLPLSKPAIGLLAFMNFTVNWSRFFLPFVMLSSPDTQNLPVGLSAMVRSTSALRPTFLGSTPIKRPEVALAAVLMAIPVVLVFLLAQRFVVRGALTGATKE